MFGELPFATLPISACLSVFSATVTNEATAQDNPSTGAEILWRPIDTNQTPDWVLISTVIPDNP